MRFKRNHFTLLEILVVLFLLTLGLALTGVKVKEIYREQQFLSESHQILSHLRMAQDLMIIMDTDVDVHFLADKKGEKIDFWLEVEKPLVDHWARLVERKLSVRAIQSIEFQGNKDDEMILHFSLGKMSKGILQLTEKEKNEQKRKHFLIKLLGYPSNLQETKEGQEEGAETNRSELLYPVEVYEELYKDKDKNNQ